MRDNQRLHSARSLELILRDLRAQILLNVIDQTTCTDEHLGATWAWDLLLHGMKALDVTVAATTATEVLTADVAGDVLGTQDLVVEEVLKVVAVEVADAAVVVVL